FNGQWRLSFWGVGRATVGG
ncbi:hypothetical protein A2U01_0105550, partial [Trifolium medium]|nr:hypothetical protein [Trifolium medium]